MKNVGGAGGLIGSNQLGEAAPNGESIGFFTLDVPGQLIGNSAMRTHYSDFVLIAGVESPLVVYMRKDTPPGINVAGRLDEDAGVQGALAQRAEHQHAEPGARARSARGQIPRDPGLSRLERGRDRDPAEHRADGQLVALGLERLGRADAWDMSSCRCGSYRRARTARYPRSKALPNLQTFEEFYAAVHPGKPLAGNFTYQALRAVSDPQLAMFRVAMMPPKSSGEAVAIMRAAFAEMWKNPQFLADYSKVIKTEPILVTGAEGQEVLNGLATVSNEIKEFLVKYTNNMTSK